MNKFKILKEKLKQITLTEIRELGWVDHPRSEYTPEYQAWFKKDNYFLCSYTYHDENNNVDIPIIKIVARDPSLITWMLDSENFRVTLKCPTKEHLEIIMTLL